MARSRKVQVGDLVPTGIGTHVKVMSPGGFWQHRTSPLLAPMFCRTARKAATRSYRLPDADPMVTSAPMPSELRPLHGAVMEVTNAPPECFDNITGRFIGINRGSKQ